MAHYHLSKQGLEMVLHQLAKFEEYKDKLIDNYVEEFLIQRTDLKSLFDSYIFQLEQLVQNVKVEDQSFSSLPFVIIGSEVELLNLTSNTAEKFTITVPYQNTLAHNGASYLSPIGKALLLKSIEEQVDVKTPGGLLSFEIRKIVFPSPSLNPADQQNFFSNNNSA